MDIAQAALRLTTPDQLLTRIDLQRIAAQAPTRQLQADVVNDRLTIQLIGDPTRCKPAIVLPFGEFIIIEAVDSMF